LTALAQAAVGFDAARGDLLTVEDLAFDENRSLQPVSPFRQALDTAENSPVLVKYIALLAGLLVVLAFGVRPALGHARQAPALKVSAKGTAKELPAGTAPAEQTVLKPPQAAEMGTERSKSQEIFEQVTGHLKQEPTQSSRLLQSWIHSD
jgi:flagellar M-ring protein FliF